MQIWHEQFEKIVEIAKRKFAIEGGVFTLKALESRLGVSQGKSHHWKKGQRPSADDLEAMSREFDLSPRWLLLGEGNPEDADAPCCAPADPIAQRVDQVARAMREAGVDELKILSAARDMLEGEIAKLTRGRGGYGAAEPKAGMPKAAEASAQYPAPKKAAGDDTV